MKQIIQMEHNKFKNPCWQKANQLPSRGFELGTSKKKIRIIVRAGLEPRSLRITGPAL